MSHRLHASVSSDQKRGLAQHPSWLIFLTLSFLGVLYASLFLRFRAYEIDNPWYLSFSRNFWVDRVGTDTFLNGVFPDGMGGTAVFGRGPALVQGFVLNRYGWSPEVAMLLSVALVLAGLLVWYRFLRASGQTASQATAATLALGLTEPFVDMANRFRYEPYGFLLMTLAFWAAAKHRPWLALTISLLALETEPAAGMVFACIVIYLLRSGVAFRTLLSGCALALFCFAVIYGLLHPGILGTLRTIDWQRGAGQREWGGFLRAYFVERRRHLIELLLLTVCTGIYVLRFEQVPPFVRRMAELVLLVTLCSLALNWPTPAYMVFWFPAALVVACWCVAVCRLRVWVVPATVAALMMPQYLALAWLNRHEGYRPQDLAQVREAIRASEQSLGLNDRQTRIMGDYSLWFAHPARFRAIAWKTIPSIPDEDLFVCYELPLRPPAMVDTLVNYCANIRFFIKTRQVEQLVVRNHLLRILVPVPGTFRPQGGLPTSPE